jgi:anti-sigma B factor antagonist
MDRPAGGIVEIDHLEQDGAHTLRLIGELDMAGVPSLEGAFARICADGTRSLTIDMQQLGFIDSTGLAAIVHVSGVCARHGYSFELIPGPPAVQRLFEVTGLDGVLPFAADGRAAHDGG